MVTRLREGVPHEPQRLGVVVHRQHVDRLASALLTFSNPGDILGNRQGEGEGGAPARAVGLGPDAAPVGLDDPLDRPVNLITDPGELLESDNSGLCRRDKLLCEHRRTALIYEATAKDPVIVLRISKLSSIRIWRWTHSIRSFVNGRGKWRGATLGYICSPYQTSPPF